MLGYTEEDVIKMIEGLGIALDSILVDKDAYDKIAMTQSFLQGLQEEGYFK